MSCQVRRWQQGSDRKTTQNVVWHLARRCSGCGRQNVRLGTVADLPTRAATGDALAQHIGALSKPKVEMTLFELSELL